MKKLMIAVVLISLLSVSVVMSQKPESRTGTLKMPTAGRSQHILFTGKVKEGSVKELQQFFLSEMMPILRESNQIKRLDTYANVVGDDFKFVAVLELGPNVPISFDTAFKVFSNGRTPEQALATINRFASFFEASSTSIILYRPDLSISRDTAGTIHMGSR